MKLIKKICYLIRFYTEFLINFFILKFKNVSYEQFPKINGKIFIRNNNGSIALKKNIRINSRATANPIGGDIGTKIVIGKNAELIIGNDVGISNSAIVCAKKIVIGDNVLIGGGCKIWDTDFHPLDPIERRKNNTTNIKCEKIEIGNNVFIGGNCIILKGVKLGENCIIGAGSVVTKSIPSNEIWAGNPARYIRNI